MNEKIHSEEESVGKNDQDRKLGDVDVIVQNLESSGERITIISREARNKGHENQTDRCKPVRWSDRNDKKYLISNSSN